MTHILILGFTGALGVLFRYFIGDILNRVLTFDFPFSTLIINSLGSLLIGIVYVVAMEKNHFSHEMTLALSVGFLGGFTTFSTYSLDTFKLIETQQTLSAFAYILGSPILGIAAVFLGVLGTRALLN